MTIIEALELKKKLNELIELAPSKDTRQVLVERLTAIDVAVRTNTYSTLANTDIAIDAYLTSIVDVKSGVKSLKKSIADSIKDVVL